MAVRAAKFADIPHMALLLEESYRRSIYAGKATFDIVEAKQLIVRAINRHGHINYGGSLVLVSETAGMVNGLLIGVLDNVYPCLKELVATDLLFIQAEHADPKDGVLLLKNLIAWAEANPRVIEIHLGVASTVGDWERTGKLYERLGLERCGAMFRMGFDRASTQEVRHVQSG